MAHSFFPTWRHPAKPAQNAVPEVDPADLGTDLGLEARLGSPVPAPLYRRAAAETREAEESLGQRLESVFSHYGI
jgi:hypothetical protein